KYGPHDEGLKNPGDEWVDNFQRRSRFDSRQPEIEKTHRRLFELVPLLLAGLVDERAALSQPAAGRQPLGVQFRHHRLYGEQGPIRLWKLSLESLLSSL